MFQRYGPLYVHSIHIATFDISVQSDPDVGELWVEGQMKLNLAIPLSGFTKIMRCLLFNNSWFSMTSYNIHSLKLKYAELKFLSNYIKAQKQQSGLPSYLNNKIFL